MARKMQETELTSGLINCCSNSASFESNYSNLLQVARNFRTKVSLLACNHSDCIFIVSID